MTQKRASWYKPLILAIKEKGSKKGLGTATLNFFCF